MEISHKHSDFKNVSLIINLCMTAVHSMLCTFFYVHNVKFMFIFNIFSIALYLQNFIIIKHGAIRAYTILTLSEVIVHLTAAVICCGWTTGFEFYTFGVIAVIYFTKYIYGSEYGIKYISEIITLISTLAFIFLRAYTWNYTAPYSLPQITQRIVYTTNMIFVFAVTWLSLLLYTKTAWSTEGKLIHLAEYDPLTGLFNRRKMQNILSSVKAETKGRIYITMMDIDDFKKINDTYGHDAGDYVLKTVASVMKKHCAKYKDAYISRWGGEEFLLIQESFEETPSDKNFLIKNICKEINSYNFLYNSNHIKVTLTGGVAQLFPKESIDLTIKKADDELYYGKTHGKNQMVFNQTSYIMAKKEQDNKKRRI